MKQQVILNMVPQYNLNLRLAHKDTLKEIYLRLARLIMLGKRISHPYFQVIKDKQKKIYFFGGESGPISEETYGDIEPFKRKEIKIKDLSAKELEELQRYEIKRVLPGRVL